MSAGGLLGNITFGPPVTPVYWNEGTRVIAQDNGATTAKALKEISEKLDSIIELMKRADERDEQMAKALKSLEGYADADDYITVSHYTYD